MVYRKLVQNLLHKSGTESYSEGTSQLPCLRSMMTQVPHNCSPLIQGTVKLVGINLTVMHDFEFISPLSLSHLYNQIIQYQLVCNHWHKDAVAVINY